MIDTKDLTSYYPGYDEYCEPKIEVDDYDYYDEYREEMLMREDEKNENKE